MDMQGTTKQSIQANNNKSSVMMMEKRAYKISCSGTTAPNLLALPAIATFNLLNIKFE